MIRPAPAPPPPPIPSGAAAPGVLPPVAAAAAHALPAGMRAGVQIMARVQRAHHIAHENDPALRRIFLALDVNGDGVVTIDELAAGSALILGTGEEDRLREGFVFLDRSGAGRLTYDQFRRYFRPRYMNCIRRLSAEVRHKLHAQSQHAGALATFRSFDTNNDNLISCEEFAAGVQSLVAGTVSQSDMDHLMCLVDLDINGVINYAEWCNEFFFEAASITSEKQQIKIGAAGQIFRTAGHVSSPKSRVRTSGGIGELFGGNCVHTSGRAVRRETVPFSGAYKRIQRSPTKMPPASVPAAATAVAPAGATSSSGESENSKPTAPKGHKRKAPEASSSTSSLPPSSASSKKARVSIGAILSQEQRDRIEAVKTFKPRARDILGLAEDLVEVARQRVGHRFPVGVKEMTRLMHINHVQVVRKSMLQPKSFYRVQLAHLDGDLTALLIQK